MNIVQDSEMLKDVSDQQLTQAMQSPSGAVPPYLVLTEMKRREDLRRKAAMQGQMPQSSVAEDKTRYLGLSSLMAQRQMMQPMPPQGQQPGMPPQQIVPQVMQGVPPQQRFAEGGAVARSKELSLGDRWRRFKDILANPEKAYGSGSYVPPDAEWEGSVGGPPDTAQGGASGSWTPDEFAQLPLEERLKYIPKDKGPTPPEEAKVAQAGQPAVASAPTATESLQYVEPPRDAAAAPAGGIVTINLPQYEAPGYRSPVESMKDVPRSEALAELLQEARQAKAAEAGNKDYADRRKQARNAALAVLGARLASTPGGFGGAFGGAAEEAIKYGRSEEAKIREDQQRQTAMAQQGRREALGARAKEDAARYGAGVDISDRERAQKVQDFQQRFNVSKTEADFMIDQMRMGVPLEVARIQAGRMAAGSNPSVLYDKAVDNARQALKQLTDANPVLAMKLSKDPEAYNAYLQKLVQQEYANMGLHAPGGGISSVPAAAQGPRLVQPGPGEVIAPRR